MVNDNTTFDGQASYNPNPNRGCGNKVKGGFYLEAQMGNTGVLAVITSLLGTMVEGSVNCLTNIPPRQMMIGNMPASLSRGEFVSVDVPYVVKDTYEQMEYQRLKGAIPMTALFDHVGARYYTPWSFMKELNEYGPSRRVPQSLINKVIDLLPLPIVFVADMTLFESVEQRDYLLDLMDKIWPGLPERQYTATWQMPEWTLYAKGRTSGCFDHYYNFVLWRQHQMLNQQPNDSADYQQFKQLINSLPKNQAPFCVSWMTKASYVLNDNDGDDVIEEMYKRGIDVIVLDDCDTETN